jgi:hypothetical protein
LFTVIDRLLPLRAYCTHPDARRGWIQDGTEFNWDKETP